MNKIFILIGPTGNLGKDALNFFLNKNYDEYYFISRKPVNHNKGNLILVDDLSNEENVKNAFNKISREKNNYYYLLNTVGGYIGGSTISETSLTDWQRMISLNLTTTFLIAKNFIQLCNSGSGGSFVTISALSGIYPEPNKAPYSISKNGINYLIRLLALENKSNHISFNAIAPYIIDSKENREWVQDKSLLISKENICKLAEDIFNNTVAISGNIFELPYSNN
ncbi:MAG: SDR family NAD(P)-dependent oxidoreductase [Ignavibacteria bacterium]|nr:SDR family NAD(P)-dependent oxidoreductase [Ignavibacteria bacterium]